MRRSPARQKQTKRKETYWVFISYSTTDSWIAHVMKEQIETLGARAYLYEKDLAGGDVIVEEILLGVDICDEAIVLISAATLQKPEWVTFEIGAIRGQHKRVTPILNNVDPGDLGPVKDIRGLDLNRFEQFLVQLRKRIDEQAPRTE